MKIITLITTVVGILSTASMTCAAPLSLRFIGQQTIATGATFGGLPFGGLSGVDYSGSGFNFTAISDDRSDLGPARFYSLTLNYNQTSFQSVTINSQTSMLRPDGTLFPSRTVDPEAIRGNGSGGFYWTSEGNFSTNPASLAQPFIREMKGDGGHVRGFNVPNQYNYIDNATSGARSNFVFEGLALTPNGQKLFAANEEALVQDGPLATLSNGTLTRLTAFDVTTGQPTAQYAYNVEPLPKAPVPAGSAADNGLSDMLALSDTDFLAVERSFANGVGNTIRIFLTSTVGATDVSALASLTAAFFVPMSKTLVLDLDVLGIQLDNIEGISFGPTLANGNRSLVLVSDNNFNNTQTNLFLAFEVQSVPEPAAVFLLGFGLVVVATIGSRSQVTLRGRKGAKTCQVQRVHREICSSGGENG